MLTTVSAKLTVDVGGITYPAYVAAGGAAYEIFSTVPAEGFVPNPREAMSFRRFVHASEVALPHGVVPPATDAPMCVPLTTAMSWATVHRTTQTTTAANTPALRL